MNFPETEMPDITSQTVVIGAFALVCGTVVVVLLGVFAEVITIDTAAFTVSSLLAIATFGYVVLTYSMAKSMEDEMEHSKEVFKLRRKDDIISVIENEVRPVLIDVRRNRSTFNANDIGQYDSTMIDGAMYHRLPRLDMSFDDPGEPATLSKEVDVNAGDVYHYFHTVKKYRDTYDKAVHELSMCILENHDDLPIDTDKTQEYAESALSLEAIGVSRSAWKVAKEDVTPLRAEITDLTRDLSELKREIKESGHTLAQDLGSAEANLKQEYYITNSDL
ncbi:hypothetical protein [Natrialbaceae archaeon AArc-T1-2]|uniref:hypothetical protein n=1 Tax=Natrialbaceae archaeon AArc-T1-2 TaxID=3053904 RepID=UPI00255A8DFB|nr:hypothetical protein [Natrialbaceae archaeon AArc-T1-2]WIV66569.1 hypothetical protein QQ977_12830 [Natrialbaceae archaeon AArc-T1-2]